MHGSQPAIANINLAASNLKCTSVQYRHVVVFNLAISKYSNLIFAPSTFFFGTKCRQYNIIFGYFHKAADCFTVASEIHRMQKPKNNL